MNYVFLAIPFFWLLIAVEVTYDTYRKTGYYRINDFISSINAGIISRVDDIFRKLLPLAIYAFIEANFAIFDFAESTALWIFAFVFYDFCYYWRHRFGHLYNFFWAAHVVHHSSEEYNLSTALRQSSSSLMTWIFYVPMALMGIDPIMLVTVGGLNLIYQFWVHTRFIPKLGFLEWFFITPSNHRVHHAINDQYIDRNYGGVFILWDRMFNSFQEELDDEPCIYGIRKPLHNWNPLWMNVHFYVQLMRDAWYTKRWQDKFLIWIKPTGWRPEDVKERFPLSDFDKDKFIKYDNVIPVFNKFYALFQQITLLVITYIFLTNMGSINISQQIQFGMFVLLSSYSLGALTEGYRWAASLEYFRYLALLFFAYHYSMPESLFQPLFILSVLSIVAVFFGLKVVSMGNRAQLNE